MPTHIDPCSIVDAVLEIQFEGAPQWALLPGIVYPSIKERYPHERIQPLNYAPPTLRNDHPELNFQAHIHFESIDGNSVLLLGPGMVGLSFNKRYPGWTHVFNEFKWLTEALKPLLPDIALKRLGLRIIDFFQGNISSSLNMAITMEGKPIECKAGMTMTALFLKNSSEIRVRIGTGADLSTPAGIVGIAGTAVDIDVCTTQPSLDLVSCPKWFAEAHDLNKQIFFNLLKKEFLDTLQPTFDHA